MKSASHLLNPPLTRTPVLAGWLLALAFCLLTGPAAWAGLGPENCVLVINSESASSRRIGNEYITLRKIPANNVIHLSKVPQGSDSRIGGKEFTEQILKPVLAEISRRKLDRQIDCIIYSTGFPTAVKLHAFMEKENRKPNKIENPLTAITSATYFYRYSVAEEPGMFSLEANAYARRSVEVVLNVPFVGADSSRRFSTAKKLYEEENWTDAEREFGELLKEQPFQYGLAYWQCRCLAQAGDKDAATKAMMDAIKRGWEFLDYSQQDAALASLQDFPPFAAALKTIKEPYWELAAPTAFNARIAWGPNGLPERLENSGHAYLLCTMLGVSSGAEGKPNSDEEILRYLRRSVAADHSHPEGKFYFADHGDVRSTTRKPNFAAAEKALKVLGFDSIIDKGRLPKAGDPILGATIGSAKFDWGKSGARLAPGAIGDNLTSFGGRFDKNGQTALTEFLRYGAAGASGTVIEPYAIQHKFPHPLIHAYYARGFSLAESFFMALAGPFQTLVVGDPMCQPFADAVGIEVEGATANQEVSGNLALNVKLDQKKVKAGSVEFYFDGMKVGALRSGNLRIDTTKHPDGYHELRIVSVSEDRTRATDRFVLPLQFQNHGNKIDMSAKTSGKLFQVEVKAPGADEIVLVSQGRTLQKTTDDSASWNLPAAPIGPGQVSVRCIARFGDQQVASVPVVLDISP